MKKCAASLASSGPDADVAAWPIVIGAEVVIARPECLGTVFSMIVEVSEHN